jgi:hypothetical protein
VQAVGSGDLPGPIEGIERLHDVAPAGNASLDNLVESGVRVQKAVRAGTHIAAA